MSWQCPEQCPHQSDDSKLAISLSIASRVALSIAAAGIVGFQLYSIVDKEDRAPTAQESCLGLVMIFCAYYPDLARAAVQAIAKRYLKE